MMPGEEMLVIPEFVASSLGPGTCVLCSGVHYASQLEGLQRLTTARMRLLGYDKLPEGGNRGVLPGRGCTRSADLPDPPFARGGDRNTPPPEPFARGET